MTRRRRLQAWLTDLAVPARYVPDLEAHRRHDEAVMARARARHCDRGRHAFITGNRSGIVGGLVETWCSICDTTKVRTEPVHWITEHPGGVTYAVCDLRALSQRTQLVLAGPFGTFEDLRAAANYYVKTTADVITVRIADAATWATLGDPIDGPRLLIEALGRDRVDAAEVPA
jgi:hypothetical protein